jgi:hypothetical protein
VSKHVSNHEVNSNDKRRRAFGATGIVGQVHFGLLLPPIRVRLIYFTTLRSTVPD